MQRRRGKPVRAGAALLSVALALPAGVSLRTYYDAWRDPYPTVAMELSSYVDADPAEAQLRRFVVTTATSPGKLRKDGDITEAVRIGPRQVAIATTMSRSQVRRRDDVEAVAVDPSAHFFSADPGYSYQWALENAGQTGGLPGADVRWVDTRGHGDGRGATVAVIDSGIDFTHPDLAQAQWRNADENCTNRVDDDANGYVDDCTGWDFVNNDNQQFDQLTATGTAANNDHGTHIAGTIAATADNGVGVAGVAPGAAIMPLKVGENGSFPHSRLVLAIDYAIANGADVINASWGGTSSSSVLQAAIQRAHDAGVLFVAAAGNDGSNNDVSPRYPAGYNIGAIVAVGASTHTDVRAGFSNYGATTVDLFAPGERILATLPGHRYGYMSGTSMAAPHVAAVAALLVGSRPGLSLADLKGEVLRTAEQIAALDSLAATGARLDAAAAIGLPEGGIAVAFDGFDGFVAEAPTTAGVTVAVSDAQLLPPNAQISVRATLGVVDDGAVRGVLAHQVNDTTTDSQASLSLSGGPLGPADMSALTSPTGLALPVATALPPGQYALMVELVDEAQSGGVVVGAARAVLFDIADPAAPPPEEQPPGDEPVPPGDPVAPGEPTNPVDPGDPGHPGDPSGPSDPVGPSDPGDPDAPGPAPEDPAPQPGDPAPQPADPAPQPGDGPEPPDDGPPGGGPAPAPGPQPGDGAGPAPAPSESPTPSPLAPKPVPPPDVPPSPGDPADPAPAPPTDFRVAPNAGPTNGGTLVEIAGEGLPADAYVHFGGSSAYVLYQDAQVLYAVTPAHVAGTVDVEVVRHGQRVVLPSAFTFRDVEGTPPPEAPPPPGGSPPPGGTTPGEPVPPDDGTTPPPDNQPPPEQNPPDDDQPPGEPAPDLGRMLGKPYKTARGLLVDSFAPGHPLAGLAVSAWDRAACREPRCDGLAL